MDILALVSGGTLALLIALAVALLPGWTWSRDWSYRPFGAVASTLPIVELALLIGLR